MPDDDDTQSWEVPLFGFKVRRPREDEVNYAVRHGGWSRKEAEDRWFVELPHQCDKWEVNQGRFGDTIEEAINNFEAFIEEAQEALRRLKNEEEWDALAE